MYNNMKWLINVGLYYQIHASSVVTTLLDGATAHLKFCRINYPRSETFWCECRRCTFGTDVGVTFVHQMNGQSRFPINISLSLYLVVHCKIIDLARQRKSEI